MSEIINFKQKRKAKEREEKEKKAAENRRKFGRTKAEKQAEKQKLERDNKLIDFHKRESDEE